MSKLNTLKSLGSLFRSSIKSTTATTSSLDASSASIPKRTLVNSHKCPQPSKPPSPAHLPSLVTISVDTSSCSDSEDPTRQVSHDISSKLSVDLLDSERDNGGKPSENALEVRLGTAATLNVGRKLGGETVMKEFNALLKICIETASTTDDWMVALKQVSTAFEVFTSMQEQGLPLEEESYGQVLLYLIDRGMFEFFHLLTDLIRYRSASALARLGYYEMLLYRRVNDEETLQEFINCIVTSDVDGTIRVNDEEKFQEFVNYIYTDKFGTLRDGLSVGLLDSEGDNGGKPSEDALEVPCLGTELGAEELNALLEIYIGIASTTDDSMVALEQVSMALEVFRLMKQQGFPLEEESYGQVLLYLIDRGMVEAFHFFTAVIRYGSASTLPRLGYYEMLLYIRVNDEEKVQEFINCIFTSDGDGTISLRDVVPRAVVDGGDC